MTRALAVSVASLGIVSSAAAQWAVRAPAPVARSRWAGAIVEHNFYVFGGEGFGGANEVSCFKYDIRADSWSRIADMPSIGVGLGGVTNMDAAAIGGDIYVPGGWDGFTAMTNRMLKYDSVADTWTEITTDPLPTPLLAHCVTASGGKLYVFSGMTFGGNYPSNGYIYDPAAPAGSRWRNTPPPPTIRRFPSGVALNGKIYVVGGIGTLTTIEHASTDVYDIASNSWSTIPDMSVARGAPAAYARGADVYVVSGGWSTYLTSGESFNGAGWRPNNSCNVGVRSAAHDGNGLYLVKCGGWSGFTHDETEVFFFDNCPCVCNYDAQTGVNVCDIFDFLTFQNMYAAQVDCACNLDGSSGPGVCDIFDFLEFQNRYVVGCQ